LPVAALARLALFQGDSQKAQQILLEAKSALSQNPEGYRLLGEFYFSLGDIDRATAEFASLYQQYPNDLRVKKNYIQLLILKDQLDEASKLNDEILKSNSRDVEALIHRGQVLNRRGEFSESIRVLEAALGSDRDNPVAHYHLGLAYSATGSLDRAEREWREAVRLRPSMSAAQQELAGVAIRKGDFGLLRETAEQIILSSPTLPTGYILRGTERLARNDRPAAAAAFQKAIEVAPTNPAGYIAFAAFHLNGGNSAQAERLYEQALDRDPASAQALQGLAAAILRQKQSARAAARVQQQIDRLPNNASFYLVLGQVMAENNDLDKAEAAFRRATERDSKNLDAFLLLASMQARRGSVDAAVQTYERNIQNDPRDVRSFILLGALEESRSRFDRARQLYEQALQVSPDNPIAANNLAYILLEHGGDEDTALSLAQVARRGLPKNPNTADTLAWAYYRKGAYTLAIGLLQEALKDVSQNATYHYHLGLAYQRVNNPDKARQHLRRALELQPGFDKADDARRALAELGG